MKQNFITYITTKKINNYLIPPPMQIMLIKNYCNNNDILFSLPIEELIFKDCHIELMGIIRNLENIDEIIMTSIFLLPRSKVEYFFNSCKKNKVQSHFIMESIIIDNNDKKINEVCDLLAINNIINDRSKVVTDYLKNYYS